MTRRQPLKSRLKSAGWSGRYLGVDGIHLKEKCRRCNKRFTKKRTPSMQARALTPFENRWKYLCNSCALLTSYLWDRLFDGENMR